MATQGKVFNQDWSKTLSTVRSIISGDSGKPDTYDPAEMSRVNQSLNAVSDFANSVAPEEMEAKYNSIPADVMSQLNSQSHGVSATGSMSNYQLKAQAKDYGYKLGEDELDYLQSHPGIQKSYLEVKKASSMWKSDQMEEMMATILKDIKSGKLANKGNLKTRLQNYLRMGNGADLDYITDDLWSDFTANMTDGEKMKRVKSKYKELFGYEDRTGGEKLKRGTVGLLNGVKEKTVNGLQWLTEAISDVGLSMSYQAADWAGYDNPEKMPDANLWAIDDNALSEDTKEAVDYLRAYGLGTGAYNALDVYYDAMHETFDAKIANFYQNNFADFGYGAGPSSNVGEDAKTAEAIQENDTSYKIGNFIGASIPEIYVTSKIGAMMGLSPEVMSKLPWWAKFGYRIIKSGTEGVAFSAMEEGEVDPTTVGIYTAMGTIVEPAISSINSKLTRWGVRKWIGKDRFNTMTEEVINKVSEKGIRLKRSDAEKIVADAVLEGSMGTSKKTLSVAFSSNPLDTASTNLEEFVTDLQKSIITDLKGVNGKYENTYIRKMLNGIFKQSAKDVDEAYSVFRNARIGAGMSEEEVTKQWNLMKQLYEEGGNKFSLADQEMIKENMRTIANTYSKTDKPLNGQLNARWRDQQISAQNVIKDIATQNGIADLSDRYLQESVLIQAKKGFEKSATTSMQDIINRYAGRTLVGGLGAYAASQVLDDGPLSNPYVATATTLLVMSMGGSPRASLLTSKIASKLSTVEAYSIINSADEGTFLKMKVREPGQWGEGMQGVIYTDTIQEIMERMEDNSVEVQRTAVTNNEYLDDMIKNKYGLY